MHDIHGSSGDIEQANVNVSASASMIQLLSKLYAQSNPTWPETVAVEVPDMIGDWFSVIQN